MIAGPLRRFIALVVTAVAATMLPVLALPPAGAAGPAGAAAPDQLFTPLPGFAPKTGPAARVLPSGSAAYAVDVDGVAARLAQAPTGAEVRDGARPVAFSLPDPAGRMVTFRVQENRVMQARLAARHPEIRTYAGTGVTDPSTTIRLDVTPMGFHASVLGVDGLRSWYVDPADNRPGTTTHLSYLRSAVPAPELPFLERERGADGPAVTENSTEGRAGAIVQRRTFRLALVTDQTYAAYFGTANVTAAKATLVNRVNQVYNDDLAVEMVLVNGTDRLNLDTDAKAAGPDGPCGANPCYDQADLDAGCSGALLDRNEFVLGQIIGADKFDVGHIGLGINGGGIAGLGVVGEQYKADGCTGLPFPQGDFYAIDYVAHEIGHQFGGNHTFNGTLANCSLTNRNGETSVEPGSGSSVMAYAGICGRDDLQPHSDPYFSQRSIDEITAHVTRTRRTYDEEQVVNLRGYDTSGESFQLTYPGATPVTITRGAGGNYNVAGITQAVQQLTGEVAEVSGYDGATSPGNAGFTLDFSTVSSGIDLETFGVQGAGDVTGFVGTIYNGGPGTNRGVATATTNHAPVVTAPADRTIPVRTPFTLTATGSDADGTTPTYLWEQNDAGNVSPTGGTALLSNTKTNGPLFRVFGVAAQVSDEGALQSPAPGENGVTTDPSRTFPDLAQVLAGNTNAATGGCPAPPAAPAAVPQATVDCYSEFLPTADYGDPVLGGELNFRVTARDGFATGGGTDHDDVVLTLDPAAGPLLVSSRATAGQAAQGGTQETLTWAVNGTDAAGLAPNVSISLSTDGGQTFPRLLVAATPNDGSQAITWPDVSTTQARIRIDAVDNYFFDVNDAAFTITSPLTVSQPPAQTVQYSDDFDQPVTVTARSENVDGDQLTATVAGLQGATVTPGTASADGVRPGTRTFTVAGPVLADVGNHELTLTVKEPDAGGVPGRTAQAVVPVAVDAEDATVDWTGPTQVQESGSTASVPLQTSVVDAGDGAPGVVTTGTVTFVDRGTGSALCTAPVTGGPTTGTAGCTAQLARNGDSTTYTIGTVVGGNYLRDQAVDDTDVTISRGAPDTEAPDTRITSGPAAGSFYLKARATLAYDGGSDATSYRCRLDGKQVDCGAGSVTLRGLSTRTHVFTVAARDDAGNVDPTPARRVFVSPFNDSQLDRKGDWTRHRSRTAYRGTWLGAAQDGATLTRSASGIRQITLVVGTSPRAGRVAVYFRGNRVATVSLRSGSPRARVLLPVVHFRAERSGLVRIESLGDGPVRIEGLGLR